MCAALGNLGERVHSGAARMDGVSLNDNTKYEGDPSQKSCPCTQDTAFRDVAETWLAKPSAGWALGGDV